IDQVSTTCVSRWDKEASMIHPLTRMVLTSSSKYKARRSKHGQNRKSFSFSQRESIGLDSQLQVAVFRSIPQTGHRPRQSSLHSMCPGRASRTSSFTRSSSSIVSPLKTERFKSSDSNSCCSSSRHETALTNRSSKLTSTGNSTGFKQRPQEIAT